MKCSQTALLKLSVHQNHLKVSLKQIAEPAPPSPHPEFLILEISGGPKDLIPDKLLGDDDDGTSLNHALRTPEPPFTALPSARRKWGFWF